MHPRRFLNPFWLLVVLAISIAGASCSTSPDSSTLATITDVQEDVADANNAEAATTDNVITGEAPQLPGLTVPSESSSPSRRQQLQSSGTVARPEAVERDAAEAPTVSPPADAPPSSDSAAPAPVGPVVTIPVAPNRTIDTDRAQRGVESGSVDPSQSSARAGAEPGAEECGDSLCNGLEPVYADPIAAEDEAPVETDVIERPSSSDDSPCPPGASADCSEDYDENLVEPIRDDSDGNDDDESGGDEVPTADCDARPWARGCPGPAPDEDDASADVIFPDDDPANDSEGDDDDASGVYVPKEVQDELLAPVDQPDRDENDDESAVESPGDR